MEQNVNRALVRLLESLESEMDTTSGQNEIFIQRLKATFPKLVRPLHELYGDQYDFFLFLEDLILRIYRSWSKRTKELRALDAKREQDPGWFKSEQMVGAVCYVDLFAGDLKGLESKLSYFNELGITYLHLMPLFKSPEGENDGGYAVSSYRHVDAGLGTMTDLKRLIKKFRKAGISVVLDFINNHTSDEHTWAKKALKGNEFYKDFYYFFPDRSLPDAYERNLREIFPEIRRGCFTQLESGEWVWTSFHSYQWDLKYHNPEVLISMAEEMLYLANLGVEVLRLDAVPFTWKELGTDCENLPEAHAIIKVLNAIARVSAPALTFKSEAIVHPDDVAEYIDTEKCQVSYNPTLMALLWEALATRDVKLLKRSLEHRFDLDDQTAWVNYVRSHDDIGWTFSDEDAGELGINGYDHRQFLNRFYSGDFKGSFSKGVKFQYNPTNKDMRICGTTASLAGLEEAIQEEDKGKIDDAVNRITLLYGIVMCIGGIPLIYLGDEIATLNDYSYTNSKEKKEDSRWVHRVSTDWKKVREARNGNGISGEVFKKLRKMIGLRKEHPAFGTGHIDLVETGNGQVLGFTKKAEDDKVLVLANFSESTQRVSMSRLSHLKPGKDLISGRTWQEKGWVELNGYDLFWIEYA